MSKVRRSVRPIGWLTSYFKFIIICRPFLYLMVCIDPDSSNAFKSLAGPCESVQAIDNCFMGKHVKQWRRTVLNYIPYYPPRAIVPPGWSGRVIAFSCKTEESVVAPLLTSLLS